MNRFTNITIATLLLVFLTTACSKPAQNSGPESTASPAASPAAQRVTSESVVKVEAQPVEIPSGGSGEAVVKMTIQAGYHVNANPPTYSYLRATELVIPASDGVSVGYVTYPKALSKKFPFAENPLGIYEGKTEIKAMLKADKSAKPGQRSISSTLRIQACDEQVCYPPGTLELAIPVNVK